MRGISSGSIRLLRCREHRVSQMPVHACWRAESLAASAPFFPRRAGMLAQLPEANGSELAFIEFPAEWMFLRQVGGPTMGSIDQIAFSKRSLSSNPVELKGKRAVYPAHRLPHPSCLERSVSGNRGNQRLNIMTMFLHLFGHLLFLRRHLRLLLGVSISVM